MFTQCPDCQAAFRITAGVLQQARGKVRCGGCGGAFNALEHLFEKPPAAAALPQDDGARRDGGDDTGSQALLETLEGLSGPDDVRIQDTGVEWLVVDEEDETGAAAGAPDTDAPASMNWFIEDVDDTAGGVRESAGEDDLEIADTAEQPILHDPSVLQADSAKPAERRYDDNTPLPDDFDDEDDYVPPPVPTPRRRATDYLFDNANDAQVELELSEPDDWMDVLDEVVDVHAQAAEDLGGAATTADAGPAEDAEIPLEVEEELAAIHDALAALPESTAAQTGERPSVDALDDVEPEGQAAAPPDTEAAASELDESGEPMSIGSPAADAPDTAPDDEPTPADDSVGRDLEPIVSAPVEAAIDQLAAEGMAALADEGEHARAEQAEVGLDEDAGSEPQPEVDGEDAARQAEGLDAGGIHRADDDSTVEIGADTDSAATENAVVYEEPSGEFERAIAEAEGAIISEIETDQADREDDSKDAEGADEATGTEQDATRDDRESGDEADDELDDLAAMTGSMKIDRNLLRAMQDAQLAASMKNEDGSPVVETIVMEGDSVRGLLDADTEPARTEQDIEATLEDPGSLIDTYMMSRRGDDGGGLFSGRTAFAGIVLLALALAAQLVHAFREDLATYGAFNQTIGPIYRLFGSPIVPKWNIKGWQFRSTSGSTGEDDELLTISSRISNRSGQPLPYPLVHVSLTDRYEEIIGSLVLEPNQYLAGNADPSQPVAPGSDFTAVITIASPSAQATGFKLNVCYRVVPGRVRCAIEDFKGP